MDLMLDEDCLYMRRVKPFPRALTKVNFRLRVASCRLWSICRRPSWVSAMGFAGIRETGMIIASIGSGEPQSSPGRLARKITLRKILRSREQCSHPRLYFVGEKYSTPSSVSSA